MSRSSWKPIPIYINKKINQTDKFFIFNRNLKITKNFLHKNVQIHNGIRFFEATIINKMVGLKFGELSPTRKIPLHKKKKNKKK